MKTMKCPKCGAKVEEKYIIDGEGKKYTWLTEEAHLTDVEKRLQKRMGLPFRHMKTHRCGGK